MIKEKKTCKFHTSHVGGNCKWCTRWWKTYEYFKKRNCTHLTYYWVIMEHYRTGEKFGKIGLTSTSVEKRFDNDLERFKIEIKRQRVLPLYAAVTLENHDLHQLTITGRIYNPKARISGWSECFI